MAHLLVIFSALPLKSRIRKTDQSSIDDNEPAVATPRVFCIPTLEPRGLTVNIAIEQFSTTKVIMSVRAPTFSGRQSGLETGASVLDGEILAEMAASLGRVGLALEKALQDLEDHQPCCADNDLKRAGLVRAAADCAWALFIQYELAGLSSQQQLIRRYRIPAEVVFRIGVVEPAPI